MIAKFTGGLSFDFNAKDSSMYVVLLLVQVATDYSNVVTATSKWRHLANEEEQSPA